MREVAGGSELERENRLAGLQKSTPGFYKLVGWARKSLEAAHESIVEKPERCGSELSRSRAVIRLIAERGDAASGGSHRRAALEFPWRDGTDAQAAGCS